MRETPQHFIANPIFYSEMVYQTILDLRQAHRQQLERLISIERKGAKIFRLPFGDERPGSGLTMCDERIGVVGLVVDTKTKVGYVTRLRASRSQVWHVADNLPFRDVHVRDSMLALLRKSVNFDRVVPELLAFTLTDTLGEGSRGGSMDIAALMAVIDVMNCEPEQFAAAAAVVSPGYGGDLVASDRTKEKLEAFMREFGDGTLLIRHTDDFEAAKFDDHFIHVWEVASYEELSDRLDAENLLEGFLQPHYLTGSDSLALEQYLAYLKSSDSMHSAYGSFLSKIQHCVDARTPLDIRLQLLNAEEDLFRDSGRFMQALECCEKRVALVESEPQLLDYDESILAANRLSSALIDAHRFNDAISELEKWDKRVSEDPKICSPGTRTFLWNTLARAKAIAGVTNWDELFHQSIQLQQQVDISYVARTVNYRIHALLKNHQLDQAEEWMKRIEDYPVDPVSGRFLGHLQSELVRRRGRKNSKEEVQALIQGCESTCHSTALRFQAIARQVSQEPQVSRELFSRAAEILLTGVKEDDHTNIKRLLANFCQLAAASSVEDLDAYERALEQLAVYMSHPFLPSIRAYYSDAIGRCQIRVSKNAVEELFSIVPYF